MILTRQYAQILKIDTDILQHLSTGHIKRSLLHKCYPDRQYNCNSDLPPDGDTTSYLSPSRHEAGIVLSCHFTVVCSASD